MRLHILILRQTTIKIGQDVVEPSKSVITIEILQETFLLEKIIYGFSQAEKWSPKELADIRFSKIVLRLFVPKYISGLSLARLSLSNCPPVFWGSVL